MTVQGFRKIQIEQPGHNLINIRGKWSTRRPINDVTINDRVSSKSRLDKMIKPVRY